MSQEFWQFQQNAKILLFDVMDFNWQLSLIKNAEEFYHTKSFLTVRDVKMKDPF